MRLVYPRDEHENQLIADYVAALIPRMEGIGFGHNRSVGVVDKTGTMVAGWVWHNWDPVAEIIECSSASITPKWMTRSILHELFSYAFDGASCQMVTTRNSADNERLHRQLFAFGFDRYDVARLFGRDEDAVFWTLTDDQWRASRFYLKDREYGQAQSAKAA